MRSTWMAAYSVFFTKILYREVSDAFWLILTHFDVKKSRNLAVKSQFFIKTKLAFMHATNPIV